VRPPLISSRHNALVSQYRAAARGGHEAPLLLDGPHLIAEALAAGTRLRHVVVCEDALNHPEIAALLARLAACHVDPVLATASVMDAVSPVRSPSPIVALADRPGSGDGRLFEAETPLVLIACNIQDPGNLGAIVRVGEAGGASGLFAAGESADPFGWKALRGSMGSALRLPIVTGSVARAIDQARAHHCRLVAATPRDGQPLYDADLRGAVAFVLGAEGAGLPASALDAAAVRVTIPMHPPVDSLNVAVTAGLLVFEARRQRQASTRSSPR
jgi:TrmH family RNA methyltransferase